MLRPTVSRSVCLRVKHLSGAYDQVAITLRQLRVCWCGSLSLTREHVCRLQLLLVLASAVILGSCFRFEIPPTWRTRSPYLYPPGTGWPSYTPRHRVPFSSPFTTRRTTVEVFEPASTLGSISTEAETYCRQPAGTLTPGIAPRWDPWPYIQCQDLCFFFPLVDPRIEKGGVGLFIYKYRLVFTYYTLLHLRLHFFSTRDSVVYIYKFNNLLTKCNLIFCSNIHCYLCQCRIMQQPMPRYITSGRIQEKTPFPML
jgi:hypothetical protein